MLTATKTVDYRFGQKHIDYIDECLNSTINIAEGAVRAGKTIDNCFAFAWLLDYSKDAIHLASGSTLANAKLNIGVSNGYGLEAQFRGRCRWGKYRDNEALYVNTPTGEKIVIFAGGGQSDSFKKIRGNSYGLWIATEIDQHHKTFIEEAQNRQLAADKIGIFWDLNPNTPKHWIYVDYIDKWIEKYKNKLLRERVNYQHFTIDDNITISETRKQAIKERYQVGTLHYRRAILGERVAAEGLIYEIFASDNKRHLIDTPKRSEIVDSIIGIDFGESNSHITMQHIGVFSNLAGMVVLDELYVDGHRNIELLKNQAYEFAKKQFDMGWRPTKMRYDLAQATLGEAIGTYYLMKGLPIETQMCTKRAINDRIHFELIMFGAGRFKICKHCKHTIEAFNSAMWNSKTKDKDERLDDGTSNIDTLDATEYAFEPYQDDLKMIAEHGGE